MCEDKCICWVPWADPIPVNTLVTTLGSTHASEEVGTVSDRWTYSERTERWGAAHYRYVVDFPTEPRRVILDDDQVFSLKGSDPIVDETRKRS
jgi:hypothetical protein